jgi:hypothetical protein
MKKIAMGIGVALLSMGVALAAPRARTFRGEIMDSACAKLGSHDMMMKKEGIKTKKDCTIGCVTMGSKYVLYNASGKTVYELDDQKTPEQFAGEEVRVTGTLDQATRTIHVTGIKAAK